MFFRIILGVLCLNMFTSVVQYACAEDRVYRIGVEAGNYGPYHFDDGGAYKGFLPDIVNRFAVDLGYQVEYVALPVNRLNHALVTGQIDIRMPDNPNWYVNEKSAHNVHYSKTIISSRAGLNVFLEYKTADIKTIGMILGFNPIEYQEDLDGGHYDLIAARDVEGVLRIGILNRVDAVYGDYNVFQSTLRRMGEDPHQLIFKENYPYSEHDYQLSTITEKAFLNAFDAWLQQSQDVVTELKRQHSFSVSEDVLPQ